MKLNTIKNAYIPNKPSYNYEINDEDNVLVAKGHLLTARQKDIIGKYTTNTIDDKGLLNTLILNKLDFYAEVLIQSLTWWVLDEDITLLNIEKMDLNVIVWLALQILNKNAETHELVEANSKN